MSTAITFIPAFAAITLLIGGFNELSVQLTLIGILAIILHTAITPTELSGPYPNFDNYHPTQPPFRDYVLVFGLAGLGLVALFSRFYPLLWSLARDQPALKDTGADRDSRPTPRTPSPLHTFTDQWTATESTLVVGSPASIAHQATGPREVTDPSEMITLELKVSRLEVAMEELRCRIDVLTTGEQMGAVSGIPTPFVTKRLPIHTPAPPLNLDTTLPPSTRPLSPSPSPLDPNPSPLAASKSVDATINAREHLRSLVESIMEGTRQTDQLIHKMRNILTEANTTDDTIFEACKDEDNLPPVLLTSISTQVLLNEHLPPSSTATSFVSSPDPSPSLLPSTRPDQPLQIPTIRRVRDTSPLPPAVNRMSEAAGGSPRTPKFNLTLDCFDLSQAPCSTPLQPAKEVEEYTSPSPLSFLRVLEADLGPRGLLSAPAFKRVNEADAKVHPASRGTSNITKTPPRDSTPKYKYDFISRIRERPLKALYPPSSRAGVESSLDARRNVKGKGKAVRTLQSVSDWLAERRRMRNIPPEFRPLR